MRDLFETLVGERLMLGRYVLVAIGLAGFTLLAAQGAIVLIQAALPDQTQRLSANSAPASRTYTVTRSVLDDQITTGSIPRPQGQPVNPCRE